MHEVLFLMMRYWIFIGVPGEIHYASVNSSVGNHPSENGAVLFCAEQCPPNARVPPAGPCESGCAGRRLFFSGMS